MSAAESWDLSALGQPAIIRPSPPADVQPPAAEIPAASPEQVRATEAVFSREENAEAGALLALWSAGILGSEMLREAVADHLSREEERDKRKEKPESK